MEPDKFVDRVFKRVPEGPVTEYLFQSWKYGDKPTAEGVGILPLPGADPIKVLERVMDVDNYVGAIAHVAENRSVADPAHAPPQAVRFYQRLKIPLLGAVHHELVLERLGTIQGYEVACWHMLERETSALKSKGVIRSQYNDGLWLVAPGVVGYGLSSAPRRDDVGFLKWKAMTAGADAAAPKVVRDNIEGMAAWAARS